jgi:hypothetical protein
MRLSFRIVNFLAAIVAILLIVAPAHVSADKPRGVVSGKGGSGAKAGRLIETTVGQDSVAKPPAPESDQGEVRPETIEFSSLEDQTSDFVVPALPGWISRPSRFPSESLKIERQMKAFNQNMRNINESVRQMNNSIQRIRTPRGY